MSRLFFFFLCFGSLSLFGEGQWYASGYDRECIPLNPYRPQKPLMWTAKLSVDRAAHVGYESSFYQRNNVFELLWGLSGGYMETYMKQPDSIFVGSVYVMAKLYLVKSRFGALFLLYSPAGPSLLSKNTFSTTAFTNNFVFQNQLGIGLSYSKESRFEFFAKMYHYSNGDTFPVNGGIDTPVEFGIVFKV